MIVADTNLIAYLHVPGRATEAARRVLRRDPDWHAPLLWRSEFRNVLAAYLRRGELALDGAVELMGLAERLLRGGEHGMASPPVLRLAESTGLAAYDCEFLALAETLEVPLVTSDARLLEAAPGRAVPPKAFAPGD